LAKVAEEEEDRKVLKYLLDKEKREEEQDRLAQQKKAEREKELSRLRAAQEKVGKIIWQGSYKELFLGY
jgi:hypothetical protein